MCVLTPLCHFDCGSGPVREASLWAVELCILPPTPSTRPLCSLERGFTLVVAHHTNTQPDIGSCFIPASTKACPHPPPPLFLFRSFLSLSFSLYISLTIRLSHLFLLCVWPAPIQAKRPLKRGEMCLVCTRTGHDETAQVESPLLCKHTELIHLAS